MLRRTLTALLFVLGFMAAYHQERRVIELQHTIQSLTAEQVAREGKTDKEWYEKHPMKGGSSAQAKAPTP